jgi:hypothetical protein
MKIKRRIKILSWISVAALALGVVPQLWISYQFKGSGDSATRRNGIVTIYGKVDRYQLFDFNPTVYSSDLGTSFDGLFGVPRVRTRSAEVVFITTRAGGWLRIMLMFSYYLSFASLVLVPIWGWVIIQNLSCREREEPVRAR